MKRHWIAIAKAEFYVLTASMRNHRIAVSLILYSLAFIWAVYLAPRMMVGFITSILPLDEVRLLLQVMLPGLMRSVMLFVWLILILFPLSRGLEEIKTDHWLIFLSNNVKSRDILLGSFLGQSLLHGLIVLIIAPIVISPFMAVYEVTVTGQALIYGVLTLSAISALWVSTYVTTALQSRLGSSPRGNDIAKALSIAIAVIVIIPMYAVMFAMEATSQVLGVDAFLVLPSTWGADLITWLTLAFNGIGLTEVQIAAIGSSLAFEASICATLLLLFVAVVFAGTLKLSDHLISSDVGVRQEKPITVHSENIFIRAIRTIAKGSFGSLIVVNIKDYYRKAQNLSKLAYGLVLATIMPVMLTVFGDFGSDIPVFELIGIFGIMFAIVGSFPHAGIAFLESKDQLWLLQSTPKGASKFIKARLAMAFVSNLFIALIPTLVMGLLFNLGPSETVIIYVYGAVVINASTMVAIGITAKNPNYEDTKSPTHQANLMMAMMIPMFTMLSSVFLVIAIWVSGVDPIFFDLLGEGFDDILFMTVSPALLVVIGALMTRLGITALSRPE